MDPDFVVQVKGTIFWLHKGLGVYLGLYAPDLPKNPLSTFLASVSVQYKTPNFGTIFGSKDTPITYTISLQNKKLYFVNNTLIILVWKGMND